MGFVMKQAAEQMLLKQQNGCFLLRFSDSELGGVTIAYVRKPDFRKEINYINWEHGNVKIAKYKFTHSSYKLSKFRKK